jgi:hypothetical protein
MSATHQRAQKSCTPQPCTCPVCHGLECLERPRFFAGQLLTEAELNSEQSYVRAKNRLHNRYLHGWGVVCGLEVVCHDCAGQVTIKPGYALDPCGEDIVVCTEQTFNLLEAINRCRDAHRRPRHADCDPFVPGTPPHCREVEEEWCLTIAYDELESRPLAALRQPASQPCGCATDPCGCDSRTSAAPRKSGRNGQTTASTATDRGGLSLGVCEPTRIRETFRFGVIEQPPGCGVTPLVRKRGDLDSTATQQPTFADTLLSGTLLEQILRCITETGKTLTKRLSAADRAILVQLADPTTTPNASVAQMHAALCRLRQAVIDLYLGGGHNVRCQLVHALDQVIIPDTQQEQPAAGLPANVLQHTPATYAAVARPVLVHLLTFVLQFILDCICLAFLPRCSPDPCDERLILACVTVRGQKIIRICNFGCRRYAGAFPSLFHWLSLVPIVPLIRQVVTLLCCSPELVRANSPLINDALTFVEGLDPTGKLRHSLLAGNLALPKALSADLKGVVAKVLGPQIDRVFAADTVSLPSLVGQSPSAARTSLAGVQVIEQEVKSEQEVPPLWTVRMNPFVAPGETVVMYRTNDRVLGFAKAPTARDTAVKASPAPATEIAELREELATLRAQVQALEARRKK